MQQQVDSLPLPAVPDFASLLASLTAPAGTAAQSKNARSKNDFGDDFIDGLEADVATLSYESALRAHARYKPDDSAEWDLPRRIESTVALVAEERSARAKAAEQANPSSARKTIPALNRPAVPTIASGADETRRSASVTVRLSQAECAQLQQRAAEARMTVSAYLRSCTFEAETLRAQVKAALAELKAENKATIKQGTREQENNTKRWWGWVARLMPRWHWGRTVARA